LVEGRLAIIPANNLRIDVAARANDEAQFNGRGREQRSRCPLE
jgi:hypothetical protein